MKKLLSVILSIVVLFSSFTFVASADVGDKEFDENESNDSFATANIIYKDYTVFGYLSSQYDMDYFKFTLTSKSTITFLCSSKVKGILVGLYDSSQEILTAGSSYYDDGYYYDKINQTLSPGTYYLLFLQESGYSNSAYLYYFDYESISHTHSYTSKVTKPALCTTSGIKTYTCSCGDSYTETIQNKGHDFIFDASKSKQATCTEDGVEYLICLDCGAVDQRKTIATGHSYGDWEVTQEPTCGEQGTQTRTCVVCFSSDTRPIESLGSHSVVIQPSVEATCTTDGITQGSYCNKCNEVFEVQEIIHAIGHSWSEWEIDSESQDRQTRYCIICDEIELKALDKCSEHSYIETEVKASTYADGYKNYNCSKCGDTYSELIYKITSVELSSTRVIYNGKERTPSVIITDDEGLELKKDVDYTVDYESGRKLPGKYIITVTFIGKYEGEKELEFTICPKATTGVKSTATATSSVTLSWSKTTGATGYRVYQYSPSKGTYVLKKSLAGTSYKVTGLKASTSYKFKVRPYTKVSDGTVILGDYSSVFTVKTKTANSVDITVDSATIYVGGSKTLKATVIPKDKTITWKSSDTSIVKVSSSGKVTAVKKGTATITAYYKYNGKTYKDTCKITIKAPSLKLSTTSASLMQGNTLSLKATTTPADMDVTWKSSNTSIATVSSSGKVTAKKEGSVNITASFVYKGVTYKKSCKIQINGKPTEFGDITGNVTYFYNNYRGDVSDTGAKVILIPMDGKALGLELKDDQYIRWLTYPLNSWNDTYGIYGAKVDGKGEYYISDVPVGEYILIVISNETTSGEWFDDDEAYARSVANCVDDVLSKSAAKALGEAVSYNKYYVDTVTIKNNYISHKSVDFGITYI